MGGNWYFVTFRSARGVISDTARDIIKESVTERHGRHYALATAVVMPDHAHLLIRPLEKGEGRYFSLAEILKSLKGISARKINVCLSTTGTVWQKESFDRIVRDEREWREKYEYIRGNAVRAGLAEKPEDYPWLLEGGNFINRP